MLAWKHWGVHMVEEEDNMPNWLTHGQYPMGCKKTQ